MRVRTVLDVSRHHTERMRGIEPPYSAWGHGTGTTTTDVQRPTTPTPRRSTTYEAIDTRAMSPAATDGTGIGGRHRHEPKL